MKPAPRFLHRLLCFFGVHEWSFFTESHLVPGLHIHKCKHCGKFIADLLVIQ